MRSAGEGGRALGGGLGRRARPEKGAAVDGSRVSQPREEVGCSLRHHVRVLTSRRSFWFSGCWRALAKGTAWAGFYCTVLLVMMSAYDEPNTNPPTRPNRSRFVSAHKHQNPKENRPAIRESQVEGILHNTTTTTSSSSSHLTAVVMMMN